MLLALDPNGFHRVAFSLKYSEVSFFLDSPDKEARDELPDSIENGVLKGMLVLNRMWRNGKRIFLSQVEIEVRIFLNHIEQIPAKKGRGFA